MHLFNECFIGKLFSSNVLHRLYVEVETHRDLFCHREFNRLLFQKMLICIPIILRLFTVCTTPFYFCKFNMSKSMNHSRNWFVQKHWLFLGNCFLWLSSSRQIKIHYIVWIWYKLLNIKRIVNPKTYPHPTHPQAIKDVLVSWWEQI